MSKLITPDIFKNIDTDDYLEAAIETAKWLKKHEINTSEGRHWAVNCNEDKVADEVETTYLSNRTLYSGAAGIGYFFVQLYEATGDEKWLDEAKAGADFLINTYDAALSRKPGIHTGTAGEGIFLLLLYKKTKDIKYLNHSVKIADDIYEQAIKDEEDIHWEGFFDYMGDGSAISYWLRIAEETKDDKYIAYAKQGIDSILKLGIVDDDNTIHWNLFNVHDYFPSVPDNGIIANFAHGTAGIVYLLTLYYEATKEEKYLDYAKKGVNFLDSIAIKDENSSIVPYIYLPNEDKAYGVFYLSFCHGPVGDAIVFKKLYKITKDKYYLDWYERLNNALIKAGVPEKRSAGYWNNCICCGSSGVLLHFLTDTDLINNNNIELAKRTAYKLVNDAYVDEDGRRWYDAWTRVKPWDVDSNLGLFVGDSGNASALLSLYGKLKGVEISPLPEFEE